MSGQDVKGPRTGRGPWLRSYLSRWGGRVEGWVHMDHWCSRVRMLTLPLQCRQYLRLAHPAFRGFVEVVARTGLGRE